MKDVDTLLLTHATDERMATLSDPAQIEYLSPDTSVVHLAKPSLARTDVITAMLSQFENLEVVTGTNRLIQKMPREVLLLLQENDVQVIPDFIRRPDPEFMEFVWNRLSETNPVQQTYDNMLMYGVPEAITAETARQNSDASYHQIAEILGVPYSTVSYRMIIFRHWLGVKLDIPQLQSSSHEIHQRAMYLTTKLEIYRRLHGYTVGDIRPPTNLPAGRRSCWKELMDVIMQRPNDWTERLTEHELYAIVAYFHLNPDSESPKTLRDIADMLSTDDKPVSIAHVKKLRNLGLDKLGIQFKHVDPNSE